MVPCLNYKARQLTKSSPISSLTKPMQHSRLQSNLKKPKSAQNVPSEPLQPKEPMPSATTTLESVASPTSSIVEPKPNIPPIDVLSLYDKVVTAGMISKSENPSATTIGLYNKVVLFAPPNHVLGITIPPIG